MHATFTHAPSTAAHPMQYTSLPAPLYAQQNTSTTPLANGTHPPPPVYTPDHKPLSAPPSAGSPYAFPYRPPQSPTLHSVQHHIQPPSPAAPTEGQLIDTDDDVAPRLAKAKEELMGVCWGGHALYVGESLDWAYTSKFLGHSRGAVHTFILVLLHILYTIATCHIVAGYQTNSLCHK